jgi:trans-aconitate 2-methyltransferase
MPTPIWDADLYLKFANQRTQPSLDLIARIELARPARIIDLGCGPGNSTEMLRRRWPEAEVIGLDSSTEMLAAAAKAHPAGRWVLGDAASWTAEAPFDLAFSNAALHWIPDHAALFPHLLGQVAAGGALAVQIPAHHLSPLHQVTLEVASAPAWRARMEGPRHALTKETPAFYYDVLQPLAARLDIWETEYQHVMEGPQAILDWFRGTGLRPFLEALASDDERERFERLLLADYTRAYPRQKDGRILFPFRRLFLVAYPR